MLAFAQLALQALMWCLSQGTAFNLVAGAVMSLSCFSLALFSGQRRVGLFRDNSNNYIMNAIYGGVAATAVAAFYFPIWTFYATLFSLIFFASGLMHFGNVLNIALCALSIQILACLCATLTESAIQGLKQFFVRKVQELTIRVTAFFFGATMAIFKFIWMSNVALLALVVAIAAVSIYSSCSRSACILYLVLVPRLVLWNRYTAANFDSDATLEEKALLRSPWYRRLYFFIINELDRSLYEPHPYLTMDNEDESMNGNFEYQGDEPDEPLGFDCMEHRCLEDSALGRFSILADIAGVAVHLHRSARLAARGHYD